jgi:hypothetical protein
MHRLVRSAFRSETFWFSLGIALGIVCFQTFGAGYFFYLNLSSYFSFSWDYVNSVGWLVFGARWLSDFYLLLFGIPQIGAVLTALLCGLGYVLCRKSLQLFFINQKIKNKNKKSSKLLQVTTYVLFAVFLAWLVVRPVNYFNVAFSILAMMGLFVVWAKIKSQIWRFFVGIFVLTLAYFGFGGYVYGLCLLMMAYELQLVFKNQKSKIKNQKKQFAILILAVFTVVMPYLAHKYVYLRLPADTYLAGLKPDKIFAKPPFKTWVFDETNRLFYRMHVLAWKEDWQQIQEELDFHFDRFDFENQQFTNQGQDLLNYYKLSAVLTQSLGKKVYTKRLNNPFFAVLFPVVFESGDGVHSFFWSDFYYHLGAVADSRFETQVSMVCNDFTRRNLQRMFTCNAVLKDSEFAEKYDFRIDQYPMRFSLDDSTLVFQKSLLAQREYINRSSPDGRIVNLQSTNSQNPFALEYVVFCALQYFRQHQFLLSHLNYFHRLGYTQLPPYFEEALLAARFSDSETYADLFPISEQTRNLYADYVSDQSLMNQGLLSRKTFENKYKHTYWFNFDYIQPPKIQ